MRMIVASCVTACSMSMVSTINAQQVPEYYGHLGYPNGYGGAVVGYLECNSCQISTTQVDANTEMVLQQADSLELPAIEHNTVEKFTQVCNVDAASIGWGTGGASSGGIFASGANRCMMYQAPYTEANPHEEPVNWVPESGHRFPYMASTLCYELLAPDGIVTAATKRRWLVSVDICGPYPYPASPTGPNVGGGYYLPAKPIYIIQQPGVGSHCTGTHICS